MWGIMCLFLDMTACQSDPTSWGQCLRALSRWVSGLLRNIDFAIIFATVTGGANAANFAYKAGRPYANEEAKDHAANERLTTEPYRANPVSTSLLADYCRQPVVLSRYPQDPHYDRLAIGADTRLEQDPGRSQFAICMFMSYNTYDGSTSTGTETLQMLSFGMPPLVLKPNLTFSSRQRSIEIKRRQWGWSLNISLIFSRIQFAKFQYRRKAVEMEGDTGLCITRDRGGDASLMKGDETGTITGLMTTKWERYILNDRFGEEHSSGLSLVRLK
ncbi:hypothetical protein DFH29DRAFT_877781 [Suillus ampliporus]|nr:hypothetical protein DFH29DRAFT_877781 [Suillus ampliporus]